MNWRTAHHNAKRRQTRLLGPVRLERIGTLLSLWVDKTCFYDRDRDGGDRPISVARRAGR